MTEAASRLIRSGSPQRCHPHERYLLRSTDWDALPEALRQEPALDLLGLYDGLALTERDRYGIGELPNNALCTGALNVAKGKAVRSARASARDVSELGRRARKPVSPGEQAR